MLQSGGQLDLSKEALRAQDNGEVGVKQFERYVPVMPEVTREIDRGHAASPQLTLERIAILKSVSERPISHDSSRLKV